MEGVDAPALPNLALPVWEVLAADGASGPITALQQHHCRAGAAKTSRNGHLHVCSHTKVVEQSCSDSLRHVRPRREEEHRPPEAGPGLVLTPVVTLVPAERRLSVLHLAEVVVGPLHQVLSTPHPAVLQRRGGLPEGLVADAEVAERLLQQLGGTIGHEPSDRPKDGAPLPHTTRPCTAEGRTEGKSNALEHRSPAGRRVAARRPGVAAKRRGWRGCGFAAAPRGSEAVRQSFDFISSSFLCTVSFVSVFLSRVLALLRGPVRAWFCTVPLSPGLFTSKPPFAITVKMTLPSGSDRRRTASRRRTPFPRSGQAARRHQRGSDSCIAPRVPRLGHG